MHFGEAPYGVSQNCTGRGTACGHRYWGLRWSSLWGHATLQLGGENAADTASGAAGGAPYGATERWGL
eukprot:4848130-Pyramimonas_sp.AAC.1